MNSTQAPWTAIIADDHAIVREGLKLLISTMEDLTVIGEAGAGEALQDLLRSTPACLLILDLGMPGIAGFGFIGDLRAAHPTLKILVLTANLEPRAVRAAIEAGAHGYLTKSGDPLELIAAIAALRAGQTYLAEAIRPAVNLDPAEVSPTGESEELTRREQQVLALAAHGVTTREIAERLGISLPTARKHRENLMRKLELHNAAELTAYALRTGLPIG